MLSGEESGFAVSLNGGLFEGGDVTVEVFDGFCGDGDEAGVAQDAVACGEVGRSERSGEGVISWRRTPAAPRIPPENP